MLRKIIAIRPDNKEAQLDCGHWISYWDSLEKGSKLDCRLCTIEAQHNPSSQLNPPITNIGGEFSKDFSVRLQEIEEPTFVKILRQMETVHKSKNHDYTEGRWDENFLRMAVIAEWFKDPVHKVFATMIGVKLARLAVLLNGKKPNNESIGDSAVDLSNYAVLFASYIKEELESLVKSNPDLNPKDK